MMSISQLPVLKELSQEQAKWMTLGIFLKFWVYKLKTIFFRLAWVLLKIRIWDQLTEWDFFTQISIENESHV